MLSFNERDLARRIRELGASIVVPRAPDRPPRARTPLFVAVVATAAVIFAVVMAMTLRDGVGSTSLGPAIPSPSASRSPAQSPSPSHRASPGPFGAPGPLTITGTVTELGPQGQRPVAGVSVTVFVRFLSNGYHWMTDLTDASGRYELWGIPAQATEVIYAGKSGYVQPCGRQVNVTSDAAVDIEIVPASSGGTAASAAARRGAGPFVSGVVFEQRSDGTRAPIVDAQVWLGGDLVTATTVTDSDGRYVLCSVPTGEDDLESTATGYKTADRLVNVAGDASIDLEMRR